MKYKRIFGYRDGIIIYSYDTDFDNRNMFDAIYKESIEYINNCSIIYRIYSNYGNLVKMAEYCDNSGGNVIIESYLMKKWYYYNENEGLIIK